MFQSINSNSERSRERDREREREKERERESIKNNFYFWFMLIGYLEASVMESSIRSVIIWDIIFKSMDECTNQSITFKIFLIFNSYRKKKILHFLVTLSFFLCHFLSLCEQLAARYLQYGICQCKCEKGWNNVFQRAQAFLVDKNNNAATVFFYLSNFFSIGKHNKARNRLRFQKC